MPIPRTKLRLPDEVRGLLDTAKERQKIPSGLFDHASVPLEIEQDTLLVFWGDWHLGAEGTDYEGFERDLSALQVAKHLFGDQLQVIAMGDYIDGYLPSGTPKNPTQILSPREQRLAAKRALEAVAPAVIIEGDHDEWHSKQSVEHAWLFEFAHDLRTPYAQWGTELDLRLPDQQLKVLARHRFKGSRNLDQQRPHKNLHLELGPADVVALAHTHSYPGCYSVHAKRRSEGRFIAVQSGTYKKRDDYGKKLGFKGADYGVPAVMVSPDGQIRSYDAFGDGLEELL